MTALTVLLAPAGISTAVLDVLTDLSAVGMLERFLWVTDDHPVSATRGTALSVDAGRRTATTVEDAILGQGIGRIRVGVIVPATGEPPVGLAAEQRLTDRIRTSAGRDELTRVRLLLVRGHGTLPYGELARRGWHNVLLAPEDAAGPGQGFSRLGEPGGTTDVGRHAAPAIAGVLGMWTGSTGCWLDGQPSPPDGWVRLARAFHRRIDAHDVEQALRSQVLATQPDVPLPHAPDLGGAAGAYVPVPDVASRTMAERLWAKHDHLFGGPRQPVPAPPARAGLVRTVLVQAPRFLWHAFRAPQEWSRRLLADHSLHPAVALHHRMSTDEPGAYATFLRMTNPQGLVAGWEDLGRAADQLRGLVADPGTLASDLELTALWQDYTAGALTLLDAGNRTPHMPPIQLGQHPGVLPTAAAAAPPPDADFVVPPTLAAYVRIERVQPADVLGADQLLNRLRQLSGRPDAGRQAVEAQRAADDLARWRESHATAYCAHVAGNLRRRFATTVAEIGSGIAHLREADRLESDNPERTRRQSVIARALVSLTAGAAVALAVVALLAVGTLDLAVAASVAGVLLGTWAVAGTVVFGIGQRHLLRELERRRTLQAQFPAVRANLGAALADLRLLTRTYTAFLLWSRVLGVVLAGPFGDPGAERARPPAAVRGLPRTTGVAAAVVDAERVAEAATVLRRDLYTTGWLSRPWDTCLAGATSHRGRPDEDGSGRLREWAEYLEEHGNGELAGRETWADVMARLDGPRAPLTTSLLGAVRNGVGADVRGGDPAAVTDLATFLAGIDRPAPGQTFDTATLTPVAQADARNVVTADHVEQKRTGLSRVVTLAQFSDARPAWEFVAGTKDDRPPQVDPDGPPEGPF